MALGFVLMTLAVIAATTWAFIEHKTAWISQPAIDISFITWGCYLAMVFLRVTAWTGACRQGSPYGDRSGGPLCDHLGGACAVGSAAGEMKLLVWASATRPSPVEMHGNASHSPESALAEALRFAEIPA